MIRSVFAAACIGIAGCASAGIPPASELAALEPENVGGETGEGWPQRSPAYQRTSPSDRTIDAEARATAIRKAAAASVRDEKFARTIEDGGELVAVSVEGLTCVSCAAKINQSFGGADKVAASAVDLDRRMVAIAVKPGERLDDAEIRKIVAEAGFSAEEIRRGDAAVAATSFPAPGDQ